MNESRFRWKVTSELEKLNETLKELVEVVKNEMAPRKQGRKKVEKSDSQASEGEEKENPWE